MPVRVCDKCADADAGNPAKLVPVCGASLVLTFACPTIIPGEMPHATMPAFSDMNPLNPAYTVPVCNKVTPTAPNPAP